MTNLPSDPRYDCPLCPRLVSFREEWRATEPQWHNGPVDTWSAGSDDDVRMMIIGMAPGLRGANRTGRLAIRLISMAGWPLSAAAACPGTGASGTGITPAFQPAGVLVIIDNGKPVFDKP